jgi:hypothetical protein
VANAIELQLQLNDQMTAGLLKSNAAVAGFVQQLGVLRAAAASAGAVMGMLGGAAIALGAIAVKASLDLAQQAEQLDNLAAQTGITAQRLQVLQFAFRQGGVDAGALTQGLNFLNRAVASNDPVLRRLGVTSTDSFEAFMQAARGIARMTDNAQRSALAFQVFGRGGQQIVPMLLQLANGFDGVAVAAQRSGNVLSDEQLAKLAELDRQFDKMTATLAGWGKQLAVVTAGALTNFIEKLSQIPDKLATASGVLSRMFARGGGGAIPGTVVQPEPAAPGEPPVVDFGSLGRLTGGDAIGRRGGLHVGNLANLVGQMVPELKTQLSEAGAEFAKFADQVARSFDIIGQHVYSGFFTVLTNLTNKTQTFGVAMKTLWRSIVDGILAALADLISSAITKAFIKLLGIALSAVTGNPAFTFGATAASELSNPLTAGGPEGAATFARAGGGGNTFIIQSFQPASVLSELVSPTGSMRGANSRLFEVAGAAG